MLTQLIGTLLLFGAAFALPEYGGKIIGGTDATIEDYPFVVSIRYPNGHHLCGGTILDEYWILTSAFCLDQPKPLDLTVQIGRTTISTSVDDSVFSFDRVIVHPEYNRVNNKLNDIGLIKLKKPLVFCSNVQPVKLANEWCDLFEENVNVTAIGWGYLNPGGPTSNTLQQLDYFVVPNDECRKRYSCVVNVHQSQICAAFPGGGKARSVGDWGVPLLHDGVQVGIGSFSYTDKSRFPDGYTKVSDFIDFIDSSIPKTHVEQRMEIKDKF